MVDTGVSAQVALHMHVRTRWWICNSLNVADLISDLLTGLLTRVSRMEGLVVAEAVQVLVVLLKHLHVVLAVRFCIEIVE